MTSRRYKRKSLHGNRNRNKKTRRSKRGGQQLWRLGSQKGGNWNPDYFKLGANHNYKYAPCSLTYSSIRAAANRPDHGYKIKNY